MGCSRLSLASVTRSPTTTFPLRRTPSLPRTVSLTTVARRRVPSPPSVTSWPPSVPLTPSRSVPLLASASAVASPLLCSLVEGQAGQVPFQDQRSRERVHSPRRAGQDALAPWPRQVPARQA